VDVRDAWCGETLGPTQLTPKEADDLMNTNELFEKLGVSYETLDGRLDSLVREDFVRQYRQFFKQERARKANRVVYIWSTQKPIPRLRNASNVFYIGQVVRNLSVRYLEWINTETKGGNWDRYRHIIEDYGPITLSFAYHQTPKIAESSLLRYYFDQHLEFPPFNRMGK
jgi:hypothetical protein